MTDRVVIQFHGTNGWFDSDIGCTSCISLHHDNNVFIFDAGTGIRRLDPIAVKNKSVVIFLSHLHLDHSVGLHFLQRFNPQSVKIIIPSDLVSSLQTLIAPPFTRGFSKTPYPVIIEGVYPGEYQQDSLFFSAHELLHSTSVFGYRLKINGKVFSYCVDTKLCPGLNAVAAGADVFVCDCGLKQGQRTDSRTTHLTPEEAVCIANKARVGSLVLTHFGCTRYTSAEARLELLYLSKSVFGKLLIARDGMCLEL